MGNSQQNSEIELFVRERIEKHLKTYATVFGVINIAAIIGALVYVLESNRDCPY